MNERCLNCKIYEETKKSNVPCACAWFIDNVILGDKIVDECTMYDPIKESES